MKKSYEEKKKAITFAAALNGGILRRGVIIRSFEAVKLIRVL